jgi:two-component system nitrogen regulation response regulator NtrX
MSGGIVATILIVDDEKNIRRSLEMILRASRYETAQAETGKEAVERFRTDRPGLVFLDLLIPDMNGLDILKELRRIDSDVPVIMMSGHGTIEHAVEAVKNGAYDFIEKPLTKEKVLITAHNALESATLRSENVSLRRELSGRFNMIGESAALQRVREQILKVAPTTARVLILGESGTGKELAARAIHDQSPRKDRPFVKVNCAAIPEELIESELFGVVKGAYTGAVADREGKFAQADTGTIFLDEVGDMSLKVQAKVLRVLQEGEFEKVGGGKTLKVDVRVLTATNKDLKKEVEAGRFREDLYFRLSVVPLTMPPLRERLEDLPALVAYFTMQCAEEAVIKPKAFSAETIEALRHHGWPGNIRELRNVVERVLILSGGDVIEPTDLPVFPDRAGVASSAAFGGKTLKEVREELEKACIVQALQKNNWNVTRSAAELGIERTNLHKKIKYYRIASDQLENGEEMD